MNRRSSKSAETGPRSLPFDAVVEWIIGGLLLFAPLAFGTTQAWSQEVFVLAVAAAAVVVAVKHVVAAVSRRDDSPPVWSWIYIPIGLFLILCFVQSLSLPADVLNAISPGTLRLKSTFLSDLPDAGAILRHSTLSYYPFGTHSQLVLLTSVVTLFAIVLDVYREPPRIQRLLAVIAGVGLIVAGLAAYQNLSGATTIYGVVKMMHRNAGPFMNYSHFSQFMNLSIGAALAYLLVGLTELSDYYRTPGEIWLAVRRPQYALLWLAAATCVLGPITIFLCMSRMGMISMLVATVFTGLMLTWQGSRARAIDAGGRGSVVVIVGLLVFAVLLYVGFDTVYARLATVRQFESTGGSREQILRDMVPLFRQFPLLGTGLGSYEYVFPMFDRMNVAAIATHAENEYAQLLAETGVTGLLLAAIFVGWIIRNYVRAVRRPNEPIAYAAFGLGFGLLAILIHSGSDFGQHDPANAGLTAISAALLFTLSRRRRRSASVAQRRDEGIESTASRIATPTLLLRVAALLVILFAAGAGLGSTYRARVAESAWATAVADGSDRIAADWNGSDADYIALLTPAARAAALEPTNIIYRYWTDVYRWHALARDVDPATGGIRLPAAAVPFAAEIVADLESARPFCPTFGPPLCVAGQINLMVLNHPARGRAEIEKAQALTPYDSTVSYVAGLMAVQDRDWAAAKIDFTRYVLLGGSLHDFTDLLLHAGHPEIPYGIARKNRADLQYLAGRMPATEPGWAVWIARCQSDAATLLAKESTGPGATADSLALLAAIDQRTGHPADAIALYKRALQSDYGNTAWRLQLAHLLFDAQQYPDAARQARVILGLHPESAEAQTLLDHSEARVATTDPSKR